MTITKDRQTAPGEISRTSSRISRFFMHFLMPVAALACGALITVYLLNTGPQAKPAKRPPIATLVEVQQLKSAPQQTKVSAMGEIIPAKEVEIKPQVSGEIINTSDDFQLGGYFHAGEELLKIDRTNYELVLRQLESDLATAESDLALEMGNQRIAEREITLLDEKVSNEERNLILRKPQLLKLQALRDDVLARLSKAKLDLERTTIKAPFNGVVAEKMVDIGAMASESAALAKIVGTDAFWLQLTLPVEQLRWLKIPNNTTENGSNVTIYPQGSPSPSLARSGKVVRLIAALEDQGRMAQLLVRIDDPLSLKEENRNKPKLLLGSYVRAEIEGITIDSGYRIDRSNLHDSNTVWLMNDEGKLDIRAVEVSYRGQDSIIVSSGIRDGESLVVSPLSSPVAGTALRLDDEQSSAKEQIARKDGAGTEQRRVNRVN
jgi:RND family efflux transporter MFP subunit